MIHLVLPYPPSVNAMWAPHWITRNGRRVPAMRLTDEGRKYKADVAWLAKAAGIRKPLAGRIRIDAVLYPARPVDWKDRQRRLGGDWDIDVKCLDIDNAVKVAIDGLKEIAFGDDRLVWALSIARGEPDARGERLEIDIAPFIRDTPQTDMFGRSLLDAEVIA